MRTERKEILFEPTDRHRGVSVVGKSVEMNNKKSAIETCPWKGNEDTLTASPRDQEQAETRPKTQEQDKDLLNEMRQ